MKKKTIAGVIALLGIVLLIYGIFIKVKGTAAISMIGGADGPTSVFLVAKVPSGFSVTTMIIGIVLLILAVILLLIKKKRT